jgi:hypothetical protein
MPKQERVALEAPAPADPRETAQQSTLEFHADEIVGARDQVVGAVNKAQALFNPGGNAAGLIKNITSNLQGDLQGASENEKYALQEAMKSWQTMGQHWNAISEAVTKHGGHLHGIMKDFSELLQKLAGGVAAPQRARAEFNPQEFENARQQLLGAYKTLQGLFEDEGLANSLAAVKSQVNTFHDKAPEQSKKLWARANILWGEALKHWAALKKDVGSHPVHMNSAMKKTFQHWNSVAEGKPSQPSQPSEPQRKEPIENLIAVMRQKAQMQGPDFLRQFDSILQSHKDNPEALRGFLEKQLLGKTTASVTVDPQLPVINNMRLAALLKIDAAGTFSIPNLMLGMLRYYDDTRKTFAGLPEMPELRPHMLKATETLNSVVKDNPNLKPVVEAWNRAVSHWTKIDEAMEQHGGPMREALEKSRVQLNQMLQAKDEPAQEPAQAPAAEPAQQQQLQASVKAEPPKTLRFHGAVYELAGKAE